MINPGTMGRNYGTTATGARRDSDAFRFQKDTPTNQTGGAPQPGDGAR